MPSELFNFSSKFEFGLELYLIYSESGCNNILRTNLVLLSMCAHSQLVTFILLIPEIIERHTTLRREALNFHVLKIMNNE